MTPAPRMLRAGAVWVTINNWLQASRGRWGHALLITPDAYMDDGQIREAAAGRLTTSLASDRWRHVLPASWGTAAKDLRSWLRMSQFDRSVRQTQAAVDPLFVWQHHDLFQRAGLTIARRHDRPLVLFVDAPVVWEAETWGVTRPGWGRLIERLGESPQFREADLVACVSDEVARATIARGAHPERVIITPCTADAVRSAKPSPDARKKYGLEGQIVIGWVGSFRPFHGAEAIVRAAASLQEAAPVALLMVGGGTTLESCRLLAADLGLRRAMFPGPVPHEQIPDYLSAMDVTVISNRGEPGFHYSPLKLKEYLAAGKAVVAPAVGEMARLLRSGHDALLYPTGDGAAMVNAIAHLVGSEADREAMGVQGRATYDQLFTMDRQLDMVSESLGLQ